MLAGLRERIGRFFRWLWSECRDWRTAVLLVVVVAVLYAPVWGGYLLALLFDWEWAAVAATAVLAFWGGPFTPFFPLCIAITLFLKKRWWHAKEKRAVKKANKRP